MPAASRSLGSSRGSCSWRSCAGRSKSGGKSLGAVPGSLGAVPGAAGWRGISRSSRLRLVLSCCSIVAPLHPSTRAPLHPRTLPPLPSCTNELTNPWPAGGPADRAAGPGAAAPGKEPGAGLAQEPAEGQTRGGGGPGGSAGQH